MGGYLWLMFKSPKERERAERFLGGSPDISIEVVSPFSGKTLSAFCSPDTKSAKVLSIGYSANWICRFLSDLVSREITRRFDVRRIGADSVGWYPDKEWLADGLHTPKSDYGPYTTWVAWMKDYRIEWDRMISEEERPMFDLIEAQIITLFEKLDKEHC